MPEIFDKSFADEKFIPWPAWTSNPSLFAKITDFLIFLYSFLVDFFLLTKLQIFPV